MNMRLLENRFHANANWEKPLRLKSVPGPEMVRLFDQNGYRLTDLEVLYAEANEQLTVAHRNERALKKEWFFQEKRTTGPILNHAALFERKGYPGRALEQLSSWAKENHTLFMLVKYRPKWGIDFSMDYVDGEGNAMELLHYEFDSFDFEEIQQMKLKLEPILAGMDWEDAARELLKRKNEWHGLDFFTQSDWKCAFFGLRPERFKMVAWE